MPDQGACPRCAQQVTESGVQASTRVSINDQLMLPYPVYSRLDTRLLPTYELVDAGPEYSGEGVTIAFLDSGFYPHPDLTEPENRILAYVDATGERPVERELSNKSHPSSWHGLMTSSVAAGNGTMSDHVYRGIAYRARLVLVKTGNPEGRGIREKDIERALSWVIANRQRFHIRVVNISLGGDYPSNGKLTRLDHLVEEAVASGMVVVAAAGNDGAERLVSPASAPSAITVGGLDTLNTYDNRIWRMYSSNYGRVYRSYAKPELIAPAKWLAAPMLPNTNVHNEGMLLWRLDGILEHLQGQNNTGSGAPSHLDIVRRKIRKRIIEQKFIHPHYQHVDGTSMAAPVVSAVAALMLEANPGLTPKQVKRILVRTAAPLRGLPAEKRGAGLVNAGRAINSARRASRGILNVLPLSPHPEKYQISFYYFDPTNLARHVALIGDFNDWNPEGYELRTRSQGLWQITIPYLPKGCYHYKFLVDDTWVHDRENPHRRRDGYGGFNSILDVSR
jgi:serine protease AprX